MAKRNKSQQRSNKFSFQECDVRPVTENDKWCLRKLKDGRIPPGKEPYGYIVTVPFLPDAILNFGDIEGRIVRTKKHCGTFMLQIIRNDDERNYALNSYSIPSSRSGKKKRNKKKRSRILHVSNLDKAKPNIY